VRRAQAVLDRLDPRALLAVAVGSSGVLLLALLSHLTFFGDEWDLLLFRRGFNLDVLLRPHAEHIFLAPILIYKGIQATIGMESLLPYAVVSTASFLASAVLLFIYLRERVGEWLALAGVLPVLFMGTGWEVLLLPVSINFTGSMAAGIGALLALERRNGHGDVVACALLVVSLAFSELALCFVLGAAVWIILARRSWSRVYLLAVPLVLYAVWYAGWGHTAQSHLSQHNVVHSPIYLLKGLAASFSSLLGVPNSVRTAAAEGRLPLVPLIVIGLIPLVAAVLLRKRSRIPLPASLWSSLVVLVSFWLLTAASNTAGRPPWASRYQYVGGVLLLMVLANLASGTRLRRPVVFAGVGIACVAVIANLVVLRHYYGRMSDWATRARGALAAFEVGGASADPGFTTGPDNTDITSLNSLEVGPYLSAVEAFGSPTYGTSGLANASEPARIAADQLLAKAEELRLIPVANPPPPRGPPPQISGAPGEGGATKGSCLTVSGSGGRTFPIDLPRPGVTVSGPAGTVEAVQLRRFADSFPVRFQLQGSGLLLIRSDRSPRAWQLQVLGPGPTRICGIAPAG
jgi:hypothetical protein